ncbi:efflux RND transporter periplasmic adaptor subunit [Rhodoferax sp.]|uniref:efflux RND transporter periplasmic adaptor subunit n=1 Tax=Rhodoferax sp. TaxID=50421 RepID=UPI00272F2E37|nr:efflux RND transporter periplasmic adaptor subunit [Rhodoferax sp.]MDP1531644.1 efflux RND transporter periplasmic adaptor subunit [Rhodoferax sp.]MDP1944201.1 efflux RND transporter periplasmic adaptor subunit [Rhodoferax sp.]MDP2441145.1 efflux RND transporter periplasmic adaptor subunit [Rhodoferax sp.]MDZ4209471.1 efflux RND transporter periplasmic adaptor subunit [Rhodoferax sp.]
MNNQALLKRRLIMGAVALALIGGMAYVSLRTGPLAPIKVTVASPVEGTLNPSIFGIGTVEARRSWMVGPTVAGRVLSVTVDVGDPVKAGQLLAEMDPVDFSQRLAALDASLARAGSGQAAAQAQLQDAKARSALAATTTQRNQDLARQNFISPGALDAVLQAQASANAAVQAAQANLAGTGQDLTRIQAERAALAQQRDNVRLFAPADAVVTTRDAEAGSTVVAGQPVLRLIDPASLWVKLRVDQGRSAGLATGGKASIVLRSRPQIPLSGQVARIELLADSVTEERIAQVAFDAPPAGVSVGEMAEVTLQLPATAPALLLPNAAIQHQQGQSGVWRLQDGKPEFAPVQLGTQSLDGQVQVLKGLDKTDRVVVYSQKALSSGARISVVDSLVKSEAKP